MRQHAAEDNRHIAILTIGSRGPEIRSVNLAALMWNCRLAPGNMTRREAAVHCRLKILSAVICIYIGQIALWRTAGIIVAVPPAQHGRFAMTTCSKHLRRIALLQGQNLAAPPPRSHEEQSLLCHDAIVPAACSSRTPMQNLDACGVAVAIIAAATTQWTAIDRRRM